MIRGQRCVVGMAVLSLSLAPQGMASAGIGSLFCHKSNDSCDEQPKEEKCSCFRPKPPPRASTAIAIPGVLTNQRAERTPPTPSAAPLPTPRPAAPSSCTSGPLSGADPRIDELHRDVQILKQQIRVLTTLLQETTPVFEPAPAHAPMPPEADAPAPPNNGAPAQ